MSANGVVSLLDTAYDTRVRDIWRELSLNFGLTHSANVTPWPHFSYQVAGHYRLPELRARLSAFAATVRPFRVKTTGLDWFAGDRPVLFIAVERSASLERLHADLWQAIGDAAEETSPYYLPENWVPHITLAHDDLRAEDLSRVVAWLEAKEDFRWEVPVNGLSLIVETGSGQQLEAFPLAAS